MEKQGDGGGVKSSQLKLSLNGARCVEFTKDFKAAFINMFKELKEDAMTMTQQTGNINKETEKRTKRRS